MFTVDSNIQLAAAGDVTAFEELYRTYHRRVYSLCFRMTRNAADAEDLTQVVFIQLFRKLKTFRGESTFYTWLHRLTMNEVLMHFRKPAVRRELATDDDSVLTEPLHGTQRPARTSLVDNISLKEAIRQLSPGYRAVFILHDIAGYEHGQIGKILGCAVGTSKSQLYKARLKLRQLLTKQIPASEKQPNVRSLSLKLKPDTA